MKTLLRIIVTFALTIAFGSVVVFAEFSDEVSTLSFTPTPAGNGRAVAFDGTDLYYTYYSGPGATKIYRVGTDGTAIDSLETGVQLGALSWDSSRGKLWAGAYDGTGDVFLVDYTAGTTTYQFTFTGDAAHFPGYVDGLAYDASDDTLWMSEDWGHVVYHLQTNGTVIGSWVIDLGDGLPFDNSDLELVCGTYLFLGHPGDTTHGPNANKIEVFLKDGTYTGMSIDCGSNLVEGIALGDFVLWTNNAVTNKLVPYDIALIGDEVDSLTPAPAGNGRAVAFDGTDLYYTYYGSNSIYRVATDGTAIDSFNTGVQLGALSWDANRGKLWAGAYDGTGDVYLVDYAAATITYQFTFTGDAAHFPGYVDGLAYDPSDDTLWMSEDWGHVVYHLQTDGTVMGSWVIDLGDGLPFDNSGIELVCGTYLFLGHPADTTHGPNANKIEIFLKDGTYTGMSIDCGSNLVEGLAFGDWVLWSNNALSTKLIAYDILDDLCRWICPIEVNKDFRHTNVNFKPYHWEDPDGIPGTGDEYIVWDPAHLGTPLDEVDIIIRKGKVKSTNPGQFYGVVNITGPVKEYVVLDFFDIEFDVNPAKYGGGVEVVWVELIMYGPDGYATVLTDEPGFGGFVDNDANYVVQWGTLDEMLPPNHKLMVYIKFQTSMKNKPYTGDDLFENTGYFYDDYDDYPYDALLDFYAALPINLKEK